MDLRSTSVLYAAFMAGATVVPSAAGAATTTCQIPTPCALFQNTSSGSAVRAKSKTGIGVEAISASGTALSGTTASGTFVEPGLVAESTNPSGSDASATFGFQGYSAGTPPAYGALAYGSVYGLYGYAANAGSSYNAIAYGVFGQDNVGSNGESHPYDLNAGVVGSSSYGTGVLGEANGSPMTPYYGNDTIGVYAVAEPQSGGAARALVAESSDTALEADNTTAVSGFEAATQSYMLFAYDQKTSANFYVDNSGDAVVSGTLRTSKSTYVRTRGASGTALTSYGARSTMPTLEDEGEANLVNGRAFVPIEARFADVIDHRSTYLVFLTPEGDSKGLYITQKSATGFAVREQQGGRSSLAFDYKIVAKPVDDDGRRLAIAPPLVVPAPLGRAQRLPRPASPQQRLQQRMGAAAYAAAVRNARTSLFAP